MTTKQPFRETPLSTQVNHLSNMHTACYSTIYACISIALIKPDSLPYIGLGALETILVGVDIIVLIFLITAFLLGQVRLSLITIAVALYFCSLIPSTLLGTQDFGLFVRMAGPAVAVCMLTDFAIERHPKSFLAGMTFGLLFVYSANLVSIFIYYPDGMYSTQRVTGGLYLMGFDNGMIYGLLPLSVYALVRATVSPTQLSRLTATAALAVMLVSVLYVMSVSSIIGVTTMFAIILLGVLNSGALGPKLKLALFVGWLTVAVSIVIGRNERVIPQELTELFGKDQTLTGRTDLWNYALDVASTHPLLGVGLGEWLRGSAGHYYPHPHSMLVDAIYTGGLLGLTTWAGVVVAVIYLGVRSLPSITNTIIVSGVLGLLVMEVANSTQFKALFWGVLALLAHSDKLHRMSRTASGTDRSDLDAMQRR